MRYQKNVWYKIGSLVILMALFIGMFEVNSKNVLGATSHNVNEALSWVKSLEGTAYDYDGVYGAQCVDLIKGYYKYLGVSPVSGNGCDYATNALPAGWSRIKGGVPQKGDILVYSGNSGNTAGHVAIYESDYTLWHGRFAGKGSVQKTTSYRYDGLSNPYWGLIRPDFTNSFSVYNTGVTSITETTARINAKVSPGANVTEVGFYYGTSPDSMQKVVEKTSIYVESIWYDLGTGKWTGALKPGTTYYYQIYAVIGGVTYKSTVDSFTTVRTDYDPPVTTNIRITDVNRDGYTVHCDVTDVSGVGRVCFPSWTEANDQDDIFNDWYNTAAVYTPSSGMTYSYRVNVSDHNYESGKYITHIYVYDTWGNYCCGGTTEATINRDILVTGVSLNRTTAMLTNRGETIQLTANISPGDATNKSVTWSSDNTSVATVNGNGLVTAVGDGTAVITVTTVDGGKTSTCTVNVDTKKELVILSQPTDKYIKTDEYATFSINAEGEGLNYQWQYSLDGKTWNNSGMTGAKTASIRIQGTEARNGQKYRCVITDRYGVQLTSAVGNLYVLGISQHPGDLLLTLYEVSGMNVIAYGKDLYYQWQYKTAYGSEWLDIEEDGAEAELLIEAYANLSGNQYRCIVTDGGGNQVISEVATLTVKIPSELKILSQPVSQTVRIGENAVFSVEVQGMDLEYQWQYSKDGKNWKDSGMNGANTATLTVEGTVARNGQMYRCIITDCLGKTVISNVAIINIFTGPIITSQPSSQSINEGTNAVFKVVVSGSNLSYQWQYKVAGGSKWNNSSATGAKTASLTIGGTIARNGQQYRCIITDGSGNSVTSNAATLTVKTGLSITSQPASKTVTVGEKTTFNVIASGSSLSYQWQYKVPGGGKWNNCTVGGAKTASLTVEGTTARNGQQYRCIVTDGSGNTVTSSVAILTVKAALAITSQPSSQTVSVGEKATFKVVAGGSNLSYQWQYKVSGGSKWNNSSAAGAKTASLTIEGTTARNGQQYRCIVTDGSGNSITSNAATLTVKAGLGITSQPTSQTVNVGGTATFKVVASGSNLSYQWQYKVAGGGKWNNSGATGAKTASLAIEGTAARNGQQYRCVITDGSGNSVISNVATLTVRAGLAITSQPTTQAVNVGEKATFKVVASGSNLSYQWQYKVVGGNKWNNSGAEGAKTASLTIEGTAARNGQQYRCIITDGSGNMVTSNAAGLIVFE